MNKIYINGRFLTQRITGVQRFAFELGRELIKLQPNVIFLVPSNSKLVVNTDELNVKRIGLSRGVVWEQLFLPAYLFLKGSPLLINLGNTAPLIYQNKISSIMDMAVYVNPKWFTQTFVRYYKFLFPRILATSKVVLTISENSKKDIINYLKNKTVEIVNVSCGVNKLMADNMNKEVDSKESYILAVSSLEPRKNFAKLISAFNLLSTNVKLRIVGTSGKVFADHQLHEQITNNKNIEFTGYLSDEDLSLQYSNALFFVYPSLYEGFGLPPLEAMSLGCPVVVSNTSSIPEVCGEAALYFDPHDVRDISAKLKNMIDDKELRNKLKFLGEEQVTRFSWKRSASILNEVISKYRV